jgi:hypothetical protein
MATLPVFPDKPLDHGFTQQQQKTNAYPEQKAKNSKPMGILSKKQLSQ